MKNSNYLLNESLLEKSLKKNLNDSILEEPYFSLRTEMRFQCGVSGATNKT